MPRFAHPLPVEPWVEWRQVTEAGLVAWANSTPEGREAFEEGFGTPEGRTVEGYLEEYGYRPDLLRGLAEDLGYPGDDVSPASPAATPGDDPR